MTQEGDTRYRKVDGAENAAPLEEGPITKMASSLLCGCGLMNRQGKIQTQQAMIMITLATAMRAANVADFYMTKYQSKAQEMLGKGRRGLERRIGGEATGTAQEGGDASR